MAAVNPQESVQDGSMSAGEKKARKMLEKLGLKQVTGFNKAEIRRAKQVGALHRLMRHNQMYFVCARDVFRVCTRLRPSDFIVTRSQMSLSANPLYLRSLERSLPT